MTDILTCECPPLPERSYGGFRLNPDGSGILCNRCDKLIGPVKPTAVAIPPSGMLTPTQLDFLRYKIVNRQNTDADLDRVFAQAARAKELEDLLETTELLASQQAGRRSRETAELAVELHGVRTKMVELRQRANALELVQRDGEWSLFVNYASYGGMLGRVVPHPTNAMADLAMQKVAAAMALAAEADRKDQP